MAHPVAASPQAQALAALIHATLAQTRPWPHRDSLVGIVPPPHPLPIELLTDRRLAPADKLAWWAIAQFSQTDHVGIYEIREGKNVTQRFAVNLFDSSESDIAPNPEAALQIGYVEVEGRSGWEFVRRELWKFLLLLALFVLAIEWYIYNRRIYI